MMGKIFCTHFGTEPTLSGNSSLSTPLLLCLAGESDDGDESDEEYDAQYQSSDVQVFCSPAIGSRNFRISKHFVIPRPLGCVVVQAPQDFVTWSAFSLAFMNNCCLGFAALIFSIKSRDCKVVGDPEAAAMHGRRAKYLNIIALILGIVFFISVFIVVMSDPPFFHRAVKAVLQRYLV